MERGERALWALAVFLYAAGDTGTTIVSLELGGIEAAPVAAAFLDALGYPGLVVNKALVVALCYVCWKHYPDPFDVGVRPYRAVIPALMAARGAWLVANNVAVIIDLA
jgi:hypothetical protein